MNRIGGERATRIGQRLDARCYVDAVALEIVALDNHIAEIDGDALVDPVGEPLGHRSLHGERAAHCNDAGKFHQQSVASGPDDPVAVFGYLRIAAQGSEPRIPRYIGGQDRGRPAGRPVPWPRAVSPTAGRIEYRLSGRILTVNTGAASLLSEASQARYAPFPVTGGVRSELFSRHAEGKS